MNKIPIDSTGDEWGNACATNDLERWVEHLDRIPVCDFFPFLAEQEALLRGGKLLSLSQWLNYMGGRRQSDIQGDLEGGSSAAEVRLASATYLRWIDRVETLLKTSRLPNLPQAGVVQYFVDHLAASVLIGYKRIGSTVQLDGILAVPNPEAYLDPLRALKLATSPAQLELLRRSLYSRHKVVIQHGTLIHIDRERSADVFGPTIDTLFLNDWLHTNRYARQRHIGNDVYFENPVPRSATASSLEEGSTFLEIGCGNGLLTASFACNEAKIRSFAGIDISQGAVSATFENVSIQRQLSGSGIASRGRFIIGRYSRDAVPAESDLIVCNPPYIPKPPERLRGAGAHPLANATVGTELLQQVIRDSVHLLSAKGEMLMISSTLAEREIFESVPSEISIQKVIARKVPFDIESMRGESEKQYLTWLRDDRGLETRGQAHFHDIAIYRLSRRANTDNGERQ